MKAYNQKGALLVKPDISDLEEQQGLEQSVSEGLLEQLLVVARKIEYHLSVLTEIELDNEDVDADE